MLSLRGLKEMIILWTMGNEETVLPDIEDFVLLDLKLENISKIPKNKKTKKGKRRDAKM